MGGIGMSALAKLLAQKGEEVSGSDVKSSPGLQSLASMGVEVHDHHHADHIPEGAKVVYSTAVPAHNPELIEAKRRGCTLLHRSEVLAACMKNKRALAVAGTHGKTTTSALLAHVLKEAGEEPSYAIGGKVPTLGAHASWGRGEHFVAEADESDGSFLRYAPFGAILTNCDGDHLDHYGSLESMLDHFRQFLSQVQSKDHLVYCGDDPHLALLAEGGISYGFAPHNSWRIRQWEQKGWSTHVQVEHEGKRWEFTLPLPGRHQALNALGVWVLCSQLGLSPEKILRGFQSFGGVGRRSEYKGEHHGVGVIDDYAHHPVEVQTTLEGIRRAFPDRNLIAVLQPHRYSRLKECFESFPSSLRECDSVVVTDVHSAGEPPIEGVSGAALAQAAEGIYVPREELLSYFQDRLRPLDMVVTLGAGDITVLSEELLDQLERHPPKKLKLAVLYGGRSSEHEVSLRSARNVMASIDEELFEPVPIAICKGGGWHRDEACRLLHTSAIEAFPSPSQEVFEVLAKCEGVFPVLHGPFGEDGTLQGMLEMLGLPYVGCDHRASGVCMDKVLTKRVVSSAGIATAEFVEVVKGKLERGIANLPPFPLFVKPSHLGSAIGVTRVENHQELERALEQAFHLDHRVVVEREIVGRQLEFCLAGYDAIEVCGPGEIFSGGEVYSYEKKYGPQAHATTPQAVLDPQCAQRGRELAIQVFELLGCTGMARVDFFLDASGEYWLNEVNPIPGFTSISLYPQCFAEQGMGGTALINRLVGAGMRRARVHQKLRG